MEPTRRAVVAATIGLTLRTAHAKAQAQGPAQAPEAGQPLSIRTPDGLMLSGRAYGDPARPEIVLVHGLGQSRLSWELQTGSALAQQFRIVTYDLRGHGDSDKPDSIAAYAEAARWGDDLQAVLSASGVRRPTLVGWSLGGRIIGDYIARYGTGAIAGLNLVNAVTNPSAQTLSQAAFDFAGALGSLDLSVRTNAIEGFLGACFAKQPPPAAFRRMLVFNGMVPRSLQQGILKLDNSHLDAAFSAVPRILVTYGAKDTLTLPVMSNRVATLNPAAKLSIYPDAGHTPFYEDPDRFNAELATFAAG